MSGLRIGGLGSGMDTQMMLEQLMRAERMPLDRLKQQKQVLQWKQEDYRSMRTKLLNFRTTAADLNRTSNFSARAISSTNSDVVTGTASGSASVGTYTVEVIELGQKTFAHSKVEDGQGVLEGKLASSRINQLFGADDLTGEFEINGVKFSFEAPPETPDKNIVYIDPTKESLNNVITKINNSKAGVNLVYDAREDKMFMSSKNEGEEIVFGGSSTFLTEALKFDVSVESEYYTIGNAARISVNGYELKENKSNNFTFAGVSFSAKQVGTSTITVKSDTDQVFNNIKNFVDQYNSLINSVNEKLFEPRNRAYPPLTDEQREQMSDREAEKWEEIARQGHLRNDTVLQGVLNDLRRVLGESIGDLDIRTLSQIGITTGDYKERGILHIDETKLRNAIENNPEDVRKLFMGDGENLGISNKLYDSLSMGMVRIGERAGQSSIGTDQSFIGKSIKRIDDRIFAFEDRLQRVEARYWRQFTAMEKAMDQMYNQSQWLSQQLMGMF